MQVRLYCPKIVCQCRLTTIRGILLCNHSGSGNFRCSRNHRSYSTGSNIVLWTLRTEQCTKQQDMAECQNTLIELPPRSERRLEIAVARCAKRRMETTLAIRHAYSCNIATSLCSLLSLTTKTSSSRGIYTLTKNPSVPTRAPSSPRLRRFSALRRPAATASLPH